VTTQPDDSIVYVSSTLDDDGKAAVLMQWGSLQALLTPEITLTTARDLMHAASNAEADIALIMTCREVLHLDDNAEWDRLNVVEIEELFALIQKAQR